MRYLAALLLAVCMALTLGCGTASQHSQSTLNSAAAATPALIYAVVASSDVHGDPGLSVISAFQFDNKKFNPVDISSDLKSAGILNPQLTAVSPGSKALYVVDSATLTLQPTNFALRVLDILPNGHLARTQATEFPMGLSTLPVISSNGKFLFVGDLSAGVHEFLIDPQNGHLTEAPGSPFSAGGTNVAMLIVLHPSGRFLYVSNGQGIWGYTVDPQTGALQNMASDPLLVSRDEGVEFTDPTGKFLYAQSGTTMQAFAIGADGMLSRGPVVNPQFSADNALFDTNAGVFIESMPPQGPTEPVQVQMFRQSNSGTLASVQGSPFTVFVSGTGADDAAFSLALDTSNQRLFVGTAEGLLAVNLNADGMPQTPPLAKITVPPNNFQEMVSQITIVHF